MYKPVDEDFDGHGVDGGLAGRGGAVDLGGGGGDDFAEDGEGVGYEFVFAVCVGEAGWVGLVFVVGGWRWGAEWWLSDFLGTERKGGRTHQVLRQGLVAIHLEGVRL